MPPRPGLQEFGGLASSGSDPRGALIGPCGREDGTVLLGSNLKSLEMSQAGSSVLKIPPGLTSAFHRLFVILASVALDLSSPSLPPTVASTVFPFVSPQFADFKL